MQGDRASSSAPVVVGGRGDADGGRSFRRPIRTATKAARAPRGALPPWRSGDSGDTTPSAWGRTAPGERRRRRQRRDASAGAALGRGGAVARFSVPCGGAAGSSAAKSAAVLPPARDERLRRPPSSSAGAVMPTRGDLPVVRFALRRRRRGFREAHFPPAVGRSRGPQRPRHRGAPPLAGFGGDGNDGVLPMARHCGAAAPLQDFRTSAAAAPDQGRRNRRPSFPGGVGRMPRLPAERAGNARLCCRGGSRRRCRMPLALTCGPRHGFFSWAAGSSAAAPSAAVFRVSCFSRQCAVGGLLRAAPTPQCQIGEISYYAKGAVLVAVGAGERKPGGWWCVAFVACRCGL